MGGWLLVNPRSGADLGVDELSAAAAARGIEVRALGPGEDAATLARDAGADALGSAGGDGTLAAVAAASLERGLPFVATPFGTRNHFARDLGLITGARDRLEEARLHVYTPRGEIRVAPRVVVGARLTKLHAAVDGEPAVFETPIECTIEPAALRVLVPRG